MSEQVSPNSMADCCGQRWKRGHSSAALLNGSIATLLHRLRAAAHGVGTPKTATPLSCPLEQNPEATVGCTPNAGELGTRSSESVDANGRRACAIIVRWLDAPSSATHIQA